MGFVLCANWHLAIVSYKPAREHRGFIVLMTTKRAHITCHLIFFFFFFFLFIFLFWQSLCLKVIAMVTILGGKVYIYEKKISFDRPFGVCVSLIFWYLRMLLRLSPSSQKGEPWATCPLSVSVWDDKALARVAVGGGGGGGGAERWVEGACRPQAEVSQVYRCAVIFSFAGSWYMWHFIKITKHGCRCTWEGPGAPQCVASTTHRLSCDSQRRVI